MQTGLPRPRNPAGIPIPYVAEPDDLGQLHPGREAEVRHLHLCQVCGIHLPALQFAVSVVHMLGQGSVESGSPMHPSCFNLATLYCPAFQRYSYIVLSGPMFAHTDPYNAYEPAYHPCLRATAFGPDTPTLRYFPQLDTR